MLSYLTFYSRTTKLWKLLGASRGTNDTPWSQLERKTMLEAMIKWLYPSNLFISSTISSQSYQGMDMSNEIIDSYNEMNIQVRLEAINQTTRRLERHAPKVVFPLHRSYIDLLIVPKLYRCYLQERFAYNDKPLAQGWQIIASWSIFYSIHACFHICNKPAPSSIAGIFEYHTPHMCHQTNCMPSAYSSY